MEQARASRRPTGGSPTRAVLEHRTPIDTAGLFRWFATRALDGVEVASTHGYGRALRLPRGAGILSVTTRGGRLEAEFDVEDPADLPVLLGHARRLFDLDADPGIIDAALGADPRLAAGIGAAPGIRIPGIIDLHEALVCAILGQQVTVAQARAQAQVLVDELGEPIALKRPPSEAREWPTRSFPTAAAIAEHGAGLIRGPASRTETVVNVCAALASGELALGRETPYEQFSAQLRAFKGIGPWTADYVALRFLGSPDLVLPGDVAIRAGAAAAGLGVDAKEMGASAEAFAPWRSYLMMHLWRIAAEK